MHGTPSVMPVYGSTQIYLMPFEGSMKEAQSACRVWELRGFEVLSVANPEGTRFLLTMRASTTLYVNWLMYDKLYQGGPYDGQEEAEGACAMISMRYGLDKVKDIYVTAQRDHEREYMGDPLHAK